ncbi:MULTISPECIES: recombinase family protein [Streptomyces]|uniref:recombinase family protein n=1 Tax=Streptomyces TaxID=1883 RepID=UPI001FD810A3|nr:recombinase family protein [Streptomyces griseolus]
MLRTKLIAGKNDLCPELKACHAFLTEGDALVVPSLDRYGRSLKGLVTMVAELRELRAPGFRASSKAVRRSPRRSRCGFWPHLGWTPFRVGQFGVGGRDADDQARRRSINSRDRRLAGGRVVVISFVAGLTDVDLVSGPPRALLEAVARVRVVRRGQPQICRAGDLCSPAASSPARSPGASAGRPPGPARQPACPGAGRTGPTA